MKKIKIVKSKIHEKGTFAAEPIRKGEFIGFIQGPIKHFFPKGTKENLNYPDWVGYKKNYWIDPLFPFKYINHSCDANCGISGTKMVYAVNDIKQDEEVTLDYSITELEEDWYLNCNCVSTNCRKKVGNILSLPKSRFAAYYPYIPTYMKEFYLKKRK